MSGFISRSKPISGPRAGCITISDGATNIGGVDRRARFGDWEGDTVWGKNNTGAIATHVERKGGYLVAFKL